MKKIIVTTSWDDGHKLDLKVAKLLKKYNLKGTFYISPHNREFDKKDLLDKEDIKTLSKNFEIGAHTMTHPLLASDFSTIFFKVVTKIQKNLKGKKYKISKSVTLDEAEKEIKDSKEYLEKIIKRKLVSFCYPAGSSNKKIQNLVRSFGFKYARTVERHKFSLGDNPFSVPTSLHLYTQYQDILRIARFSNWDFRMTVKYLNWEILAKKMFDNLKPGDIFHLWGHSWIIDEKKEWEKLESVFKYISNKKDIKYLENGDLVK